MGEGVRKRSYYLLTLSSLSLVCVCARMRVREGGIIPSLQRLAIASFPCVQGIKTMHEEVIRKGMG